MAGAFFVIGTTLADAKNHIAHGHAPADAIPASIRSANMVGVPTRAFVVTWNLGRLLVDGSRTMRFLARQAILVASRNLAKAAD